MSDQPIPIWVLDEWRAYFAQDGERPRGLDVYLDVFTGIKFPLQRCGETAKMMQAAREISPRTVMEIGSDKGGGFYHWIKSQPTVTRAIAIEFRGVPWLDIFQKGFPGVQILGLGASSYDPETVANVREWLGNDTIDCLFIDGDKTAFLDDFEAYLPLMSSGGIVFLHDFRDQGPKQAVDELRNRYHVEEILDTDEVVLALEREARGLMPSTPHEAWLRYWRGRSCGVAMIRL